MRDEDELRVEMKERLRHEIVHLKLAHRQKVNVSDKKGRDAGGEQDDASTYNTCKALTNKLAARGLGSKTMLRMGLDILVKQARAVEEAKANEVEVANARKKKGRSRATKTKKARLEQADATADWRTLGKKPVSGARHPQVTPSHKALLSKATAIETAHFENISKAYNPALVEFRVYGYVGLANRQSGRQVQVAPPVLEGLLASRRLGSPKHSAAAIVSVLQNKEKWDALPDPPRPIDFLDQHPVPMKMAASKEQIEKVELVHMDQDELRLFDSNDTAGPNLVYGYTLWWVLRQFRTLSQLSSSDQRSQYEAMFETYPWPLPEWQHLQLGDGKFPSPIWTHSNDKQKGCEELNRVHCVLYLSSKFPRAKGNGFSHLSNGLRKLFVAEHRNTFQSVPFRLVDFEPEWMDIKDEEEEEPEPQRVAQTIAQQDPREMYFRGGTESDHTMLIEDFSLEEDARVVRRYKRDGIPRTLKPLPSALDPRDNENEENWRDRWRMFLELIKKTARLGHVSWQDLNQPDEDPEVLWDYDRGLELSWFDIQAYIKDGNDRKVVFNITLIFPTDDSYLQDMESLRPLDPTTDRIMAMVEAEEDESVQEEYANDADEFDQVDENAVEPMPAPSTRSQSSLRAARDRARPLDFGPTSGDDDDDADATPSKGGHSEGTMPRKRIRSPAPTSSNRAGKKPKMDRQPASRITYTKKPSQQKDQVVKSIAEERPRTIYYRYGDMDEHDTILDLAEQDGEMARYTKAFKKLEIEPTDPDDQVPLDIELDPRNVSEQRCWRDMMREKLGLQDYKATIAQIDVGNDAKKEQYPDTIYHYQNAPEIPWEEFQQFIEDKARHNVIIIILRFPTDPEELNDMEWPGLFSAQQTTFIKSLRAKKKSDQDATIESLTASRGETSPAISSDTAISRKRGRGDSGTSTETAGPSKQKLKTSREWNAVDAGIADSSGTPSVGRVTTSASRQRQYRIEGAIEEDRGQVHV